MEREESVRHIISEIEADIKKKEGKIRELGDMKNKLYNTFLSHKSFKCPLGLENVDAICPKCNNVLPTIMTGWNGKSTIFFTWPNGMADELKDETRREGCIGWKKRIL